MKNLLFVLCMFSLSLLSAQSDSNGPHIDEVETVSCDCTSVFGGSNNTTCADGQNCSCYSGLFTCNCDCETPYTTPSLPKPGTGSGTAWKKNWDELEDYLASTKHPLAEDMAKNLDRVFKLRNKDYRQFYLEANFLEFQFYKLPKNIQNKALSLVE